MEHHVALNFIGIQWWNDRNNLIFIGWRYKKELIVVIGRNSLNFLAECFIEACILVATVEITWTILSRRVSLFIGYEDIGFGRKYGPFRGYQLFNIFSMCLAGYLSYLNLKKSFKSLLFTFLKYLYSLYSKLNLFFHSRFICLYKRIYNLSSGPHITHFLAVIAKKRKNFK